MRDIWRRVVAAAPVAVLGLVAVWLARDFPPVPGQGYGPGLFPTILGLILLGCAVGVVLQTPLVPSPAGSAGGRVAALSYALTPAVLFLGWEAIGWPLLSLVTGAWLLRVGGVRWSRCLIGGLSISTLTWILFPMLLRVPLPSGPLRFMPY